MNFKTATELWGFFGVSHLLWHGTSVLMVSSEGLVAEYLTMVLNGLGLSLSQLELEPWPSVFEADAVVLSSLQLRIRRTSLVQILNHLSSRAFYFYIRWMQWMLHFINVYDLLCLCFLTTFFSWAAGAHYIGTSQLGSPSHHITVNTYQMDLGGISVKAVLSADGSCTPIMESLVGTMGGGKHFMWFILNLTYLVWCFRIGL